MRKTLLILSVTALLSCAAIAQNQKKPWSEWAKKDVEKILNESAWGQTQTDTDASELTYSPTSDPNLSGQGAAATRDTTGANNDSRLGGGAKNQALEIKYRVRFFSAKPIREAFARMVLLGNPAIKPAQLQNFVDGDYSEMIVVAVTFEATDRRLSGPADQAFRSATTGTLKNTCYLERKDGKRIFLEEYTQPSNDGSGAKFVFPRMVDGKPFLSADSDTVRFVAEFNSKTKIERKFKVSEMMYNGNLEY